MPKSENNENTILIEQEQLKLRAQDLHTQKDFDGQVRRLWNFSFHEAKITKPAHKTYKHMNTSMLTIKNNRIIPSKE